MLTNAQPLNPGQPDVRAVRTHPERLEFEVRGTRSKDRACGRVPSAVTAQSAQSIPLDPASDAQRDSAISMPTEDGGWSLPKRLGFRFLFAYFVLGNGPGVLGYVPYVGEALDRWFEPGARLVVSFVGQYVFRTPIPHSAEQNGSGDTTGDYVRVFCLVVLAAIAAVAGELAHPRRDLRPAVEPLRTWARYILAAALLGYGSVKIVKLQFPAPDAGDLLTPLAERSPMGLLWTFMGFSTAYCAFGGIAEVVPGVLLLFRRTATLGSFLAAAVLTNIVLLNFTFDVPVKIYSAHLLLTAIAIGAKDAGRMIDFFVLNKRVEPAVLRGPRLSRRVERAWVAAKVLLVGCIVWGIGKSAYEGYLTWGNGRPTSPDDGLFAVESFTRDGVVVPAGADTQRWQYVELKPDYFGVRCLDAKPHWWHLPKDDATRALTLEPTKRSVERNGDKPMALVLARTAGELTVEGTVDGQHVTVHAVRKDVKSFPLMSRGFHWVNESPYNL
jgi:hypothetical protein